MDEAEREKPLTIGQEVLTPICARKMADVAGYERGQIVAIEDDRIAVRVSGEDLWFSLDEIKFAETTV